MCLQMDLNETYDIGYDNSSGVVYILFKWKNHKIVTLVKRSIVIAYWYMALLREGILLDTDWLQTVKEFVKIVTVCMFSLFGCNIEGDIGFQKPCNIWVEKALRANTFFAIYPVYKLALHKIQEIHLASIP